MDTQLHAVIVYHHISCVAKNYHTFFGQFFCHRQYGFNFNHGHD